MKKLALIGMLATLAAGNALATNHETPAAGGLPQGKPPIHHVFHEADTNKDGQLSKEEWLARGDKMFSTIDANKDGNVTQEEMKANHEAKRAEMEKHRAAVGGKGEHSKPSVDAPKPVEKH